MRVKSIKKLEGKERFAMLYRLEKGLKEEDILYLIDNLLEKEGFKLEHYNTYRYWGLEDDGWVSSSVGVPSYAGLKESIIEDYASDVECHLSFNDIQNIMFTVSINSNVIRFECPKVELMDEHLEELSSRFE